VAEVSLVAWGAVSIIRQSGSFSTDVVLVGPAQI